MAPKTPKPKTPADNAGSDVIDEGGPAAIDVQTFYRGDLPDLPHDTGAIADVFHASGYWPHLTPAQIAVHIMAGRSLGLDDAQAVFDLTITPPAAGTTEGPTIAYRTRQSYLETEDRIAAMKHGEADGANDDGKTANARETPKPALPRSNVVELPVPGQVAPFKLDISDLANKGPLTEPAAEVSPKAAPPAETTSAAQIPASAAILNETPLHEPTDPFASKAGDGEIMPVPGSIGDPAARPDPAGDDLADPALVLSWRTRIAAICDELDIKDKADRLKKFDENTTQGQRAQLQAAEGYYITRRDAKRAGVMLALKDDGKGTPDEQRGFFMYAEVPADPETWTYRDAAKAEAAIVQFTARGSAA